jgi:hypothetical protein
MSKRDLYGNPNLVGKAICGNCEWRTDGIFTDICNLKHQSVELTDTCEDFEGEK